MIESRDRLRRWRESIALGEAQATKEAIARAARQSPGQKIAIAFELSELVSTYAASLDHPEDIPPVARLPVRGPGP